MLFFLVFFVFSCFFKARSVKISFFIFHFNSSPQTAGGAQCREECREGSYYDLHHYLDDLLLFHGIVV